MILQTIKNYVLGILDRLVNPENYNERLVNFYSYFQIGFANAIFLPLILLWFAFCGIVTINFLNLFGMCILMIPVGGVIEFISRRFKI